MRHTRPVCAALLLALVQSTFSLVGHPSAASPTVVIGQIYGAGGNSGALYNADFIQLYNRGSVAVSLAGWTLQYASATGTGNFGANASQLTELTGVIPPGGYVLVQEASGLNGTALPAADITDATPIAMAAGAGKVALVTGTPSLGCNGGSTACGDAALARIVDLVGYGTGASGANFFEGAGPAPTLSATLAAFRKGAGAQDTDDNGADFEAAAPAPRGGDLLPTPPTLSVADASIAEGNSGVHPLTFTVSLNKKATVAVSYTISTVGNTATSGIDFEPLSISGVIPPDTLSATHVVNVRGDLEEEPAETFFVDLSDITGAEPGSTRATGTINNDDLAVVPIHRLQGSGSSSTFIGRDVATTGIVTARKANGFFLQTPDDEIDDLPETSEAVFVFTGSRPALAIGDAVRVTGRVVEFGTPDTLTEIGAPVTVTIVTRGNPLPAAIDAATLLTLPADKPLNARNQQLERFEGMLVASPAMDVVGPTADPRCGELFAVVAGTERPRREAGIDLADTLPAGAPATVPRFDGNFEKVMLDSNDLLDERTGNPRASLDVPAGVQVTSVRGPLDYAFGEYRIALTADAEAAGTRVPRAVPPAAEAEFTIGHVNLENYRGVSAARQHKAARLLVEILHTPDILGLIEVGALDNAQKLADEVNALAGTHYAAYLRDNDGVSTDIEQNIGYLVNADRIDVLSEHQEYFGKRWTIGGVDDVLHDRPPYLLTARVRHTGTELTVILNHLKSLIDVNSLEPYGDKTVTVGQRNREKRRLQAEDVADLIQLHTEDNLVVLGDMNAFEVNDGYADILGILQGAPVAQDLVTNYSADRWSYTLTNLVTTLPSADRYSYVFGGNAQVLDHVLVNDGMLARLTGFAYARNNADFPESFESDFSVTTRVSDHDAPVASFMAVADVTSTTTMPALVAAGSAFSFDVTVRNLGDRTGPVVVSTTIPAGATFAPAAAPDGWTCATAATSVSCTTPSLDALASATIVMHAVAQCDLANGAALTANTTATASGDLSPANEASTGTAAVSNPAPVISNASVDTPVMTEPNHKMQDVRVAYIATDTCGAVSSTLAVRSNEPLNGTGDGDTAPDWQVVDAHTVRLRAERAGGGNGRVYTITITARDSAGNTSTRDVTVRVPR